MYFPCGSGRAGADATIAGIVEMGRAKDSASSVAGRGGEGAYVSATNGSYSGAYSGLLGADHPSPPSVSGSDHPLLAHGMGPLRSASYLLAARNNSTSDAQCAARHFTRRARLVWRMGQFSVAALCVPPRLSCEPTVPATQGAAGSARVRASFRVCLIVTCHCQDVALALRRGQRKSVSI